MVVAKAQQQQNHHYQEIKYLYYTVALYGLTVRPVSLLTYRRCRSFWNAFFACQNMVTIYHFIFLFREVTQYPSDEEFCFPLKRGQLLHTLPDRHAGLICPFTPCFTHFTQLLREYARPRPATRTRRK